MRRAFTLVELLIVITVIAIVMVFSSSAIWMAQQSAREANTRRTPTAMDVCAFGSWLLDPGSTVTAMIGLYLLFRWSLRE